MICNVCGLYVARELMQAHIKGCNELAARQEQLGDTYYGFAVTDPLTDEQFLEVLIWIRDNNPDSIAAGYNRKES